MPRFDDDYGVLGSYLAEFSDGGLPSSLGGYGLGGGETGGATTTNVYLSPAQMGGKGLYPPPNLAGELSNLSAVTAAVFQSWVKRALRQTVGLTSGRWDTSTKTAWDNYVLMYSEGMEKNSVGPAERHEEILNRTQATVDPTFVWGRTAVLDRLKKRAEAVAAPAPAPTTPAPTTRTTTTAPRIRAAGNSDPAMKPVTLSTNEVQSVLKRLGFPATRLSDGKFGATTKANWEDAAKTRSLVSTITAKGSDITNVVVNERTYLMLKADADAKTGPVQAVVDDTIYINPTRVEDVVARVAGVPVGERLTADQIMGLWTKMTEAAGLPKYIEAKRGAGLSGLGVAAPEWTQNSALVLGYWTTTPDNKILPGPQTQVVTARTRGKELETFGPGTFTPVSPTGDRAEVGFYVKKSAWDKIEPEALKVQRPQPAPGPKTDQLQQEASQIVAAATTAIPVETLRTAFAATYKLTSDGVFDVPQTGVWDHKLATPLLKALKVAEGKFPVWQLALGPGDGKLVPSDLKTIKLTPAAADAVKKLAASYNQGVADDASLYKGYTEVNTADVIANINALGVSTKIFNKAGGHNELADAIKTFADNAKITLPGGDTVRVNSKGAVFVKAEVLSAIAKKAMEIKAAADVTKKYRDAMVANAVKESSKRVAVLTLQKAWMDVVLGQESGTATTKVDPRLVAVLKKVQLTGSFDAATREAYTAVAMPVIIGPAVLEFEKLLKTQLPPATWDKDGLKIVADVRSQVWNEYLGRVVTLPPGNIDMTPALAQLVETGAKHYDLNVSTGKQQEARVAAQMKVLNEAVAKSTAIVSILDLQLALLMMLNHVNPKEVGSTGVKLTGFADKPTKDGLYQLAGFIFPTDVSLPDTLWQSFLKQTGWIVVSGKEAARGWGGTTNYISLPTALADKVATRAGEYIALKGPPQVQVVKFNNPLVVQAKAPKKQDTTYDLNKEELEARKKKEAALKKQQEAEKAALEAKRKSDEAARQAEAAKAAGDLEAARKAREEAERQLEEARKLAAEAAASAAAAKAATEAQQQIAPIAPGPAPQEPPPVIAPGPTTQESAGGAAAGGAGGGAQVTGPTINITAPPAVTQAGIGMGTLFGGGALALLALLVSKSTNDEKRSRMG